MRNGWRAVFPAHSVAASSDKIEGAHDAPPNNRRTCDLGMLADGNRLRGAAPSKTSAKEIRGGTSRSRQSALHAPVLPGAIPAYYTAGYAGRARLLQRLMTTELQFYGRIEDQPVAKPRSSG